MAGIIQLDQRGPFERMMPQMLQMLIAQRMETAAAEAGAQRKLSIEEAQREALKAEKPESPPGHTATWTGDKWQFTKNPVSKTPRFVKGKGNWLSWFPGDTQLKDTGIPHSDGKLQINLLTDQKGNVTKVLTDKATGKTIRTENLGQLGRAGTFSSQMTPGEKVTQTTRAKNKAWVEGPKFSSDIINTVKRIKGDEWDFMSSSEQYELTKKEAQMAILKAFPEFKKVDNIKAGFDAERGYGFKVGKKFFPWVPPVVQFMPDKELNEIGGQVLRGTIPQ